jgi:hypothetical protein
MVRPFWVLCTQHFLVFLQGLFPGLEPITSWSQDNNFTAALGHP